MAWERAKPLRKRWAALLCVAVCALGSSRAGAQPLAEPAVDPCVPCHLTSAEPRLRDPVEQLAGSVHARAALGCIDCHGGDGAVDTMSAHSLAAGFVGKPAGITAVERCGDCHADPERIRPFAPGLALDARDAFGGSRHGLLVTAGDESAPSCPDCHGSHDTRAGADPQSSVARGRVAESCGRCHADPNRLTGHRSPTTQLDRWRRSSHGEALARGEPDAPTCTTCHGGHQDVPKGAASVRAACVSCHPAALAYLDRGVHASPQRARGLDPCLACHDAHEAPRGSRQLLGLGGGSSCGRCHDAQDPASASIADLTREVRASRARALGARVAAREANEAGLWVAPGAIVRIEVAELLLRPRIHECELTRLVPLLAELDEAAAALRREASATPISGALGGAGAARAAVALLALVPLAVALCILWRRRYRLHRQGAA